MIKFLKGIVKRIILGEKYDSKTYVNYLNSKGAKIASTVYFVVPSKTVVDMTRPYLLEIGNYVTITEGCAILTHGFDWSVLKVKYGHVIGSAGKVTIKDNCFIGVNTTILKGVTIGKNTIIGAGSVVTNDIPDNCVAVGNPCKPIMTIDEYFKRRINQEEKEAFVLITEYFKSFGKLPPEEELAEFFSLFQSYTEVRNPAFKRKISYGDNVGPLTTKEIRRKYNSYKELCEGALKYES